MQAKVIDIIMSQTVKVEKPSTSNFGTCCQSSSPMTTPDNSIIEEYVEDEVANNNTMFHMPELNQLLDEKVAFGKGLDSDFSFPKRPKVDVEFQNVKYTVSQFSFQNRKFGKFLLLLLLFQIN